MNSTAPLPNWASNLWVFDTETTGVDVASARIVSAAIALLGPDGDVQERRDWLINPGVEIPRRASEVHGISTEMAVANGMQPEVGIAQIVESLRDGLQRGYPIVAYNAPFDLSLLAHEAQRYGIEMLSPIRPVLDPLVIDKQMDRYRRGKRTLDVTAQHFGVPLDDAHEAGADAIAAGRVMQALAQAHTTKLPDDLDLLHDAQVEWAAAQAANFQEYMRRERDPHFVAEGSWPLR